MIIDLKDVDGFKSPDARPRIMQYILYRGKDGAENFVLGVITLTPGCETTIVSHPEEEAYFILEGTLDVMVGEETGQAGRESTVFIPSNARHRMWNSGDRPVRFAWVMSPQTNEVKLRPGWTVVSMNHGLEGVTAG